MSYKMSSIFLSVTSSRAQIKKQNRINPFLRNTHNKIKRYTAQYNVKNP